MDVCVCYLFSLLFSNAQKKKIAEDRRTKEEKWKKSIVDQRNRRLAEFQWRDRARGFLWEGVEF